jgi:hypothetical protein
MSGKVFEGPVTIRGDLNVTGRLNKGLDTVQANNGKALQVIQGVLQPVVTQPNVVPQSGDVRMYGQNTTINGNVVPGGTDGYFQIDEYINGAWQHLFEIQPSTTGNANVLDLFISGRVFARDSLLSAPGRFFFKSASTPFGTAAVVSLDCGNGLVLAGTGLGLVAKSTDNGLNFTSLTPPFTGSPGINAIAYGNGIFILGTSNGQIARYDGTTWSGLITNPFGGSPVNGLFYASGVWVAVGGSGKIARSTDNGLTWGSLITNSFAGYNILNVVCGNGVFIAVSYGGGIARSLDLGLTWGSLITNPFGGSGIYGLAFGNGIFIASGISGKIARSTDNGLTWGSLITNPLGSDDTNYITYGSNVFVIASTTGKVTRSLDMGLTWGIKYGSGSYVTVLATSVYSLASNGLGRFYIGGYDTVGASPIAYSDYVEAGAGIVNSGSNSNGSYVQYADGTMRCRFGLYIAAAGSATWTFPVPFIATDYRIGSHPIQGAGWVNSMQEDSTTARAVSSIKMVMYPLFGASQNLTYDMIAEGRWM